MKKTSNNYFAELSSKTLKTLTKEVKETLAHGCESTGKKIFTAAELWSIQRNGRSFSTRRFI